MITIMLKIIIYNELALDHIQKKQKTFGFITYLPGIHTLLRIPRKYVEQRVFFNNH